MGWMWLEDGWMWMRQGACKPRSWKNLVNWMIICVLFFFSWEAEAAKDDASKTYFQGLKHRKAERWKEAEASFRKTLALLEAKKGPKGKAGHILSLGKCDVLYLLASVVDKQGRKQEACLSLQSVEDRLRVIPASWRSWSINPVLPTRIKQAQAMYKDCAEVPTIFSWRSEPLEAKVEALQKKADGSEGWQAIQSPYAAKETTLLLRITAKDYQTQSMTISLQRWEPKQIEIQLKALPKPRPVTRPIKPVERRVVVLPRRPPPPPPPPPPKASPLPWILLGAGVLVAGAVTLGIVLATRPPDPTGKTEVTVRFEVFR